MKLQAFDSSYFHGKTFFDDNGFQNIFSFQNTIVCFLSNIWYLIVKKNNCTEYVIVWKSKEVYNSKLTPLHGAFIHNIKIHKYT